MELVVAGHLLSKLAAATVSCRIFKHDEIANQVEEAALFEDAFDHHLQFGQFPRRILVPRDRAPGLEPFLARAK